MGLLRMILEWLGLDSEASGTNDDGEFGGGG